MMQQQGPPPLGAPMPTASFPFELKGVPGGAKVEVNVHVVPIAMPPGSMPGPPTTPNTPSQGQHTFARPGRSFRILSAWHGSARKQQY